MTDRERRVIATGFRAVAEDLETVRKVLGRARTRLLLAAEAIEWTSEKDEGGRMKDESERPSVPTHPSSFIPHPSGEEEGPPC